MNARVGMAIAERDEAIGELLDALRLAERLIRGIAEPVMSGRGEAYESFQESVAEIRNVIRDHSPKCCECGSMLPDDESEICRDCQHDLVICRHCAGTGEGSHDGASCWSCKGSGKAQ